MHPKYPYPGCRIENRKVWDHLRSLAPIQLSGGRYSRFQMPLFSEWGFSSVEYFAHSIPAYRVFLDPAAKLTDGLLETKCDLCRHEAVNSLQVYFFSCILPYFCTGKPKFSDWVSCPWRIVGLHEDVKCSPDNGSFLLFLQIVIPRRSLASSPEIQGTRTPEEPFPIWLLTLHQSKAED